ncbi:MAG TPA: TIGR04053 family radical SAM/SPASM domain-containing protein [Streptosporangiaceae bacterium]|nr:TIGR04053 family radical SAM/SPASM domain-containing protein [Streptosporangiaceae bacterium]
MTRAPDATGRPGHVPGATERHVPDFAERPMLVFWETTRACLLACRHCRASASPDPLPGELSEAEGYALIDQVARFGRPHPILVLTGGDCLMRPGIFELAAYARKLGVPVCLSPSVTPILTAELIGMIADSGIRAVSISLDGALPETHESIRGIPGHFAATMRAIRGFADAGMTVQVNTTVMRANATELADIAALTVGSGARIWEVFFLVQVGRGMTEGQLAPAEHEEVCHFLYDAAHYGVVVRTVEAPFFRRIAACRRSGGTPPTGSLYTMLTSRLERLLGPPVARPSAHTAPTRDGKGILFVAYDGEVYPAGFLPIGLGNVRDQPLRAIYTGSPLLRSIRAAEFGGRCGRCEYADLCGGSRARAFAMTADPLGEDPACAYEPAHSELARSGTAWRS